MRRLCAVLLLLSGLLAMLSPALASLPESEVRAAIIVNFVHFVEWPDNPPPNADILICVAGRSATGDALLAFNGKTVHGRPITVVSRQYAANSGDCRILFIGESSSRNTLDWLRDLTGQHVLTISEGEDFLPNGGIVSLNRAGSRIVFDINLIAMRRANLKISSQLLRLAREVHGK